MKFYNECLSSYDDIRRASLPFKNDGGHAVYAIKFEGGARAIVI